MKCPTCSTDLKHARYENVPVHRCDKCGGYLMGRNRMLVIRSAHDHTEDQLRAEMAAHLRHDVHEAIRCPKCLERRMEKHRIPVKDGEDIHLDVCPACNVVWFDGGELAHMQLQYEQSDEAIRAQARRHRAEGLDSDGNDEFERNLAALPRHHSGAVLAFWEAFQMVLTAIFLITAIGCAVMNHPTAAAITSALGILLLAKLAVMQFEGAVARWVVVGLLVALEEGFLFLGVRASPVMISAINSVLASLLLALLLATKIERAAARRIAVGLVAAAEAGFLYWLFWWRT